MITNSNGKTREQAEVTFYITTRPPQSGEPPFKLFKTVEEHEGYWTGNITSATPFGSFRDADNHIRKYPRLFAGAQVLQVGPNGQWQVQGNR